MIAYFDCFHGASGDMLLASLFDAGLKQDALNDILTRLPLSGYSVEHRPTVSHHVSGSRVIVHVTEPHPQRTWADIRALLEQSDLPQRTRTWTLNAFARLARAEAGVHGVPVDDVHFHEVGAVDSIIDMVSVCAGLEILGVEKVFASPLPLGKGWVETQHGPLPVPAPATLSLLAERGIPILPAVSEGELVTPTAAALLAELATFDQPAFRVRHVGYGFGHKEFDRLNGVRVWLGKQQYSPTDSDTASTPAPTEDTHHSHTHTHSHDHGHTHTHAHTHSHTYSHTSSSSPKEAVVEMRCNLDDATGEVVAYAIEKLLEAGALDVWATPLMMKKGRPAMQLSCLARPTDVTNFLDLILRETPTFGVRWQTMERFASRRQTAVVATPWGEVRVKQKFLGEDVITTAPEYEDCAVIARTYNVPLATVYSEALKASAATSPISVNGKK